MSHESVLANLVLRAPDLAVITVEQSTATVAKAASALDVVPSQIAKTLALRVGEQVALLATRGDTRLDNRKAKAALGGGRVNRCLQPSRAGGRLSAWLMQRPGRFASPPP